MPSKVNTLHYSWILFQLVFISVLGVSAYTYSGIFTNSSLFSYFGYCIGAGILALISALTLAVHNSSLKISKHPGVFLLIIWAGYIAGHGFSSGNLNFRHLYPFASAMFIIATLVLLPIRRDINIIWRSISLLAAIEASWCILQWVDIFPSLNNNFAVSGTWVNPNVSAMYLTLSFPVVLRLCLTQSGNVKKVLLASIISITAALILLKCRTAFIGTGAAALIIFNHQYSLVSRFRKASPSARILTFAAALCILIPIALSQYNSKKASADGRKLIWKISLQMIADKPLSGYGYGQFEKNYNLRQAAYIHSGNASEQEIQNAGFVKMAYNEFLENTAEGGIIGLLFFSGVLFFLLKSYPKKNKPSKKKGYIIEQTLQKEQDIHIAAYAGIVSFAVMSIFNFTVQAIPCMLLFGLYAAVCLSPAPNNTDTPASSDFIILPKRTSFYVSGALGMAGLLAVIVFIKQANAQLDSKKAADLARKGNYIASVKLSRQITPQLQQSESFWINYGKCLLQTKKYDEAEKAFEKARELTSNPELYFLNGKCSSLLGDYTDAAKYYLVAKNIEPSRYKHRVALMNLYLKAGNNTEAVSMAKEILSLKPKAASEKVDKYRIMAGKVLQRFGISKKQSDYLPSVNFRQINYQNKMQKIPD